MGKKGLLTDKIHLLNPITFLIGTSFSLLYPILYPWLVATSWLMKLRATHRGRFPRVFGDKFGDKFSDEFGDKISDSPNLVTNVVINLVTNLVNHQSWC